MAPLSLAYPNVDNTIGAVFIGILGACILFGVTTVQAIIYYYHYPQDSLLHKWGVATLWVLDTLHLALTVHAMYWYLVKGYGKVGDTVYIIWSMKLQVVVMVIIIVLVQSLYAIRTWRLSGYHRGVLRYVVPAVVAAGFAIGVIFAYQTYKQQTFVDLLSIAWALDASLATETFIDFFLSLCMCYYLRKSKTSESELNSRIAIVMQYSLSSGLLTSACSLSTLFTYILLPYTFIYVALEFLLTRLYVGSFLAMLNSRQHRPQSSQIRTSVHIGTVQFRVSGSHSVRTGASSDFSDEKFTPVPKRTHGIRIHKLPPLQV